jgi:hypothetical protein
MMLKIGVLLLILGNWGERFIRFWGSGVLGFWGN